MLYLYKPGDEIVKSPPQTLLPSPLLYHVLNMFYRKILADSVGGLGGNFNRSMEKYRKHIYFLGYLLQSLLLNTS